MLLGLLLTAKMRRREGSLAAPPGVGERENPDLAAVAARGGQGLSLYAGVHPFLAPNIPTQVWPNLLAGVEQTLPHLWPNAIGFNEKGTHRVKVPGGILPCASDRPSGRR